MGKNEPMSAKAIANRIKAKGLQKIKYYCEMCKKQCRDDNGFKCHIMSESHQRQALVVSENPEQFVGEFSKQFSDGFMYILKARYRTKRVLANTVFQEYIKDREHIHMNGTRWTSLTDFANWLGEQGLVKVDESERGIMVTYIDNDPETLRRKELDAKRAAQAEETAARVQREIEMQREANRRLYEENDQKDVSADPQPIPIVKVSIETVDSGDQKQSNNAAGQSDSSNVTDHITERPVFKVQAVALKPATKTAYKPPPPKRKINTKLQDHKKKRLA